MKRVPARGDVWWLEPEDSPRRPFLVVSRQVVVDRLSSVIVVPATTRVRGIPTEVALDERDGMPTGCVLSLDNVTIQPKIVFRDWICTLDRYRMDDVCRALACAVGCD